MLDLPEDFTQKKKCVLSSEISFAFQVMLRVGSQGAKTCQFFNVQIFMKLCIDEKIKNCKKFHISVTFRQ